MFKFNKFVRIYKTRKLSSKIFAVCTRRNIPLQKIQIMNNKEVTFLKIVWYPLNSPKNLDYHR